MGTASDLYEDAALAYIRLVQQISLEAAGAIEHIHVVFGSRAALRAALIITILKIEVEQHHWIPSIGLYNDLLEDYTEAVPLTQYAMTCCLQHWAVPVIEPNAWSKLAFT